MIYIPLSHHCIISRPYILIVRGGYHSLLYIISYFRIGEPPIIISNHNITTSQHYKHGATDGWTSYLD